MDSSSHTRATHAAKDRSDNFPRLSAQLRQDHGGYASFNVDYHAGAAASTAPELFDLHAKALRLRERCELLTPMLGVDVPTQHGSGQYVIYTFRLTRDMRRLNEKRNWISTGQEVRCSKYDPGSTKRFDHHRTRVWSERPREGVHEVIQASADWRLRFERHRLGMKQNQDIAEPKPRYHGEEGRQLIRERGDRAIELTKLISRSMDDEELDIPALQSRFDSLMDVDCDLVKRTANEILQRQMPIRASPQFNVEHAELQLLRSIIAKAKVIEALCNFDGLGLIAAQVEGHALAENLIASPALSNHKDEVARIATEGAARFCIAIQRFYEVQGPDIWRPEWQRVQIYAAMAGSSTGPTEPDRMELYNYGTELSTCILVEFLLEDLGLVEAVKETRTLENMLRETSGIPIDGISFNNAKALDERIPEEFRDENDIFALGDAESSLVLEGSSEGRDSESDLERGVDDNES